jgi:mono/diheme cytochrome c family protein
MMRAVAVLIFAATVARMDAQLISRPVPPADAVVRGQKQFVTSCGFCHGATAKGGESGPDLVRSPILLDDENGDHVGPVILNGRPDKGMPSFSMTPAQISDIAAFLRERTQAAINRREYKILNIVTGDAAAGRAYFNGAGKCGACHSPTGDLAGIGRKYEPVALQTRFLYPGRGPVAQRKPSQVTVTTPAGQSVAGTLENIDDFTVGLRDSEGYYHSWPREGVKVDIRDPYSAHLELLRQYTDADMHNLLAYLVTL